MTKSIRIENACNSDYKVVVQVWDKGYPKGEPDKLVKEIDLDFPTALAEVMITSTRWLVAKEKPVPYMH